MLDTNYFKKDLSVQKEDVKLWNVKIPFFPLFQRTSIAAQATTGKKYANLKKVTWLQMIHVCRF